MHEEGVTEGYLDTRLDEAAEADKAAPIESEPAPEPAPVQQNPISQTEPRGCTELM